MGNTLNSFVNRRALLRKLSIWRLCAIIFFMLLAFKLLSPKDWSILQYDYVAQIWIEGFISDNYELEQSLNDILHDSRIKALIVNINSPGGTFVGGEKLYSTLKKISERKPTVALLGDQATSAAYLLALGTNHIIAHQGTLTGSVGVILQSFEVTELAKKVGITPIILKSSPLKGTPHPVEKLTTEGTSYLQELVDNSQEIFMKIVKERRKDIAELQLLDIKQGKLYIGVQAKENNLVDALGGRDQAIEWLNNKNIVTDIIKDININKNKTNIRDIFKSLNFINNINYKLLSIL